MSKKYTQSDLIKHVDILKLTIPRMHKLGIPTTPNNYAVWYAYSQGSNLALSNKIDDLLNKGVLFTHEICDSLYQNFIAQQSSEDLKEVQKTTKQLIQQLLKKMEKMAVGSSHFGNALKDCEKLLDEKPNVNQLTTIVNKVMQETEAINKSNQEMMSSLESMKKEVHELKSGLETLTETVYTDQLTEIANRRAFDEKIEKLFKDISNKTFSLLMIDIDHFKTFNDTHGHVIGDKVLTYVAKLLSRAVKNSDLTARYGGEEFVILLAETSNQQALDIAEKLRLKITEKKLASGDAKVTIGNITISVGVATATIRDVPKSLIERADKAMYLAKKYGRNRVVNEYQS